MIDGLTSENTRVVAISGTSGTFTVTSVGTETVTTETATTQNATVLNVTGSANVDKRYITYGNARGTIEDGITAAAVISGGMWVMAIAGSATTAVPLAYPAPASTGQPLGICLTTTASGANPPILKQGYYQGVVAEGDIYSGAGFKMGAGAALNCVAPLGGSPAAINSVGKARGTIVMGGGSQATVSVYLW